MRVVNDIREFIEPIPATFRESTQLLSMPFMSYKEPSSFVVDWYGIENEAFVFDEESVTDKVKSILYNFPAIAEEDLELSTQSDELETLIQNKYGNRIAVQSKRGTANVKYENVILYWGSTVIDRPFIVALNSESGKYAVICHPDIEKYGFVMQRQCTLLDQLNVVLEETGHSMLSSEAIGHMNALDFLEYLEHCQLGIFKNENPRTTN